MIRGATKLSRQGILDQINSAIWDSREICHWKSKAFRTTLILT